MTPKFSTGFVLEIAPLSTTKEQLEDGYLATFAMLIGRKATYVKVVGFNWEKASYKVRLFDKNMIALQGSTHIVPMTFLEKCFIPETALSMEHIVKEKKK